MLNALTLIALAAVVWTILGAVNSCEEASDGE